MDQITVKAPATSANLGAGFDICGIALERPFDIITFKKSDSTTIRNTGRFIALDDPANSIFGAVIEKMRQDFGFAENFEITINKQIRHKGGLGSSASEGVGTAFGLSQLLDLELSHKEVVNYASFGEEFIDGSRHLDNVAPCAYGGFTISYSNDPVRVKHIAVPERIECLLVLPDKQKPSTKYARELLPESIARKDAIFNSFCLSKLICGFMEGNIDLIVESLDDRVVEPARENGGILPNLTALRQLGKEYGYGVAASGAGPTLIAFGDEDNTSKRVFEQNVKDLYAKSGMAIELMWTRPSNGGVSFA